jgi:DNA-binding protein H-NS
VTELPASARSTIALSITQTSPVATYRELQEQAQKLLEQAEQQKQAEIKEALDSIAKAMKDFDISVDQLLGHLKSAGFEARRARTAAGSKGKTAKGTAKYRNPSTGETWSGRGRAPAWLRDAEESGKAREKFLIK